MGFTDYLRNPGRISEYMPDMDLEAGMGGGRSRTPSYATFDLRSDDDLQKYAEAAQDGRLNIVNYDEDAERVDAVVYPEEPDTPGDAISAGIGVFRALNRGRLPGQEKKTKRQRGSESEGFLKTVLAHGAGDALYDRVKAEMS